MPDEDKAMNPINALWGWISANGKETGAFVIVMGAACWMFSDIRDEARSSRQVTAEALKASQDREAKAWDIRSKDREQANKHIEDASSKMERMAKSFEELAREIARKQH